MSVYLRWLLRIKEHLTHSGMLANLQQTIIWTSSNYFSMRHIQKKNIYPMFLISQFLAATKQFYEWKIMSVWNERYIIWHCISYQCYICFITRIYFIVHPSIQNAAKWSLNKIHQHRFMYEATSLHAHHMIVKASPSLYVVNLKPLRTQT